MAQDVLALLDADQQRVEGLFREFRSAGGDAGTKLHMAQIICMELALHAMVEEEILYPAVAQALGDDQIVGRAVKEHPNVKDLIARIPEAENLEGTMEAIWRLSLEHIQEERAEIFTKVRAAGMELATLGGRIQTRRAGVATVVQES